MDGDTLLLSSSGRTCCETIFLASGWPSLFIRLCGAFALASLGCSHEAGTINGGTYVIKSQHEKQKAKKKATEGKTKRREKKK